MYSENDDDDFCAPTSSSNLANLFGNHLDGIPALNQSLMYVAPRQPKPEDKTTKNTSKLICAKPVTLSKLVDGKFTTLGKYGLALIGSDTMYEMIIYKDRQNIILRIKLRADYTITVKEVNFASFSDDQKQSWLAKFENEDSIAVFMLAFERCGGVVEKSVIKPNELEMKSAKSPIPSMVKNEFKPELMCEADKSCENHSDSSGSQTRAHILSRMAKMGQQILPKAARENVSDSDTDSALLSKRPTRRAKRNNNPQEKETVESVVNYKPQLTAPVNHLIPVNSQIITNNHDVLPHYDHLNLLYTENRIQNNEVKMNLSHISLQLEKLLHELHTKPSSRGDDESRLRAKVKALELKTENLNHELEKTAQLSDECVSLRQSVKEHQEIILQQRAKIENLTKQHEEVEMYKNQIAENEKFIQELQLKLLDFESFYNENKNNKNLLKTVDELNVEVTSLKQKLKDFEDHYKDKNVEMNAFNMLMEEKVNSFVDKMKTTMNMMFHNVIESFKSDDDNAQFQGTFIASVLAQNIKTTTLNIIQEFQNDFKFDILKERFQNGNKAENSFSDFSKNN